MHLINIICSAFSTLLYVIMFLDFSLALRDVHVQIPHAVKRGEKATLTCLYDLEGDSLYSVKWYKGRREFYSFTPKETPAMKVFAGVKVNRLHSNESQLVLESVNAATSGKYSCEVSADAPSFHTLIGAGELEVVVPGKDPVITGIRPRYKVGDIVRGNCTSSHSRPAANITWAVNGYETNPAHIRHFKPLKDPRELETVVSSIHFVITPQHFLYGKLKIRCTAHIHDVYWKSTEKSIEETRFGKAGSVNVVHSFSEDYFDSEEGNVVGRSDTYLTNIKGDVSSLNASGGSLGLHKFSCFWPRLTTLSLLLYAGQQMIQFLQQLFGQRITIATTAAAGATATATAIITIASKQSLSNCQTIKRRIKTTKETAQVATICDKQRYNTKKEAQQQYWPKEKYFQIKLINAKQSDTYKDKHKNIEQLPMPAVQQQHLFEYLQQECDKIEYEYYTLTMTTQVANILNASFVGNLLLNATSYNRYKPCLLNHNLYGKCCTPPENASDTPSNNASGTCYTTSTKDIISTTSTTTTT